MMAVAHARGSKTQSSASVTHRLLCSLHGLSKVVPCLMQRRMPQPLTLNTGARASFQLKALPHGHEPHGGTRPLPERRAGTESVCWLEVMVLPYRGPDGTQGGLGLSVGVWTIHEKV
jgi:hypothetical protein